MTNIKINNLTPDWERKEIAAEFEPKQSIHYKAKVKEEDKQEDKQEEESEFIDMIVNIDIKILVLFIALLCSLFLLIGFVMTDKGLQNGLDTIKENKKDNVVSERIIQKETRLIDERLKANDKVREEMKKNYNVIIN